MLFSMPDFSNSRILSDNNPGSFIFDRNSFVIFIGKISVSGYILDEEGIGRKKEVVKSSFIFLTSGFDSFKDNNLLISFWITFVITLKSWNPFISTLAIFLTLKLISWRMLPIPDFTFPVDFKIIPIKEAVSLTCSGSIKPGDVVISSKGMPNLSSL